MSKLDRMHRGMLRIALALMFGLLVVGGYVVAPILFAKAPSREMAGMLAGSIFHIANSAILILGVAVAAFWWRESRRGGLIGGWRIGLLAAVLLLIGVNEFAVSTQIVAIKAQAGPIDALAADDPLRRAFGIWHGISAAIHLCAALCMTLLVGAGAPRRG